jgi:hypothetical protein
MSTHLDHITGILLSPDNLAAMGLTPSTDEVGNDHVFPWQYLSPMGNAYTDVTAKPVMAEPAPTLAQPAARPVQPSNRASLRMDHTYSPAMTAHAHKLSPHVTQKRLSRGEIFSSKKSGGINFQRAERNFTHQPSALPSLRVLPFAAVRRAAGRYAGLNNQTPVPAMGRPTPALRASLRAAPSLTASAIKPAMRSITYSARRFVAVTEQAAVILEHGLGLHNHPVPPAFRRRRPQLAMAPGMAA